MTQLDLFDYPNSPGFKQNTTSKDAAKKMTRANSLREKCLNILKSHPMTADEVAKTLNESVLSIRPRFTELFKTNQIVESGILRENDSGRLAIVWKVNVQNLSSAKG